MAVRRKSERRKLIEEADRLLKQLVLQRDLYRCVMCGRQDRLQVSHLLPKGKYPRLRFELLNTVLMCVGCHLYWWHRNPLEAHEWLDQRFPGRREQLRIMAATAPKLDLKELIAGLRLEVK